MESAKKRHGVDITSGTMFRFVLIIVGFWFLYVLNYLINLFRFNFDMRKAYKKIAFEQEAHYNDGKTRYLSSRKKFNWTKWIT